MIKKLLIANRGEIAVRIIRACKELKIETVAVYSTADKEALHVLMADQAICIGPPAASDSYLNSNSLIQTALSTGCDAVHPGFGFLSENAEFANAVAEAGLIFVGPSAKLISLLGDKNSARAQMIKAGVPVVPGSKSLINSVDEGKKAALQIGYPVLIKASSGGGGKGMRRVYNEAEFEHHYHSARSEAKSSFKDDSVYLEKLVENPKHVEIQIIADKYGKVLHLYERDCSMQRRNQKLLEESPCAVLPKETREKMIAAAVRACEYIQYESVGTIEFLLDKDLEHFYFMEMNTRVQVEHPVSEMVTDIDIIKWQILIADGVRLNLEQEEIHLNGHAIECRINAENIYQNFSPSAGKVEFLQLPAGKDVRIETALYNGYSIPPFYDSMLLKLIVHAPTRALCIRKMRAALEELLIDGVNSNIEFQYLLMYAEEFINGKYNTGFIDNFIKELSENAEFVHREEK